MTKEYHVSGYINTDNGRSKFAQRFYLAKSADEARQKFIEWANETYAGVIGFKVLSSISLDY